MYVDKDGERHVQICCGVLDYLNQCNFLFVRLLGENINFVLCWFLNIYKMQKYTYIT